MNYKAASILVICSVLYISGCKLNQPTDANENALQAVLKSPDVSETDKKILCEPLPIDLKNDPDSDWKPPVWVDKASGCAIGDSAGGGFRFEADKYKALNNPKAVSLLNKASIFLLEKNIEQYEEHWAEEDGPEAADSNIPTLKRLEYLIAILIDQEDYSKARYYLEKMVNGADGLTDEGSQEAKEKYLQSARKFQQTIDGNDAKSLN